MNWNNKYYKIAIAGAVLTFVLQLILGFIYDPFIPTALSSFYPVWVIVFVVGWRKEHPRR